MDRITDRLERLKKKFPKKSKSKSVQFEDAKPKTAQLEHVTSLKITDAIAARPGVCLIVIFVVCLLCEVLTATALGGNPAVDIGFDQFRVASHPVSDSEDIAEAAGEASVNVAPPTKANSTTLAELSFQNHVALLNFDDLLSSKGVVGHGRSLLSPEAKPRQVAVSPDQLTLLFHTKSDTNLLTAARIAAIRKIEEAIMNFPDFGNYCAMDDDEECRRPNTITNYYYPSNVDGDIIFDGMGESQSNVAAVTEWMAAENKGTLLERTFKVNNPVSTRAMTLFRFGLPLPGYTEYTGETQPEQLAKIRTYIEGLAPALKKLETDDLYVVFAGAGLIENQINDTLRSDVLLGLCSLLVVFCYTLFHTRSLLLTSLGLLGIIMSFAPTVMMQTAFFGQSMSFMNLLSIWVILGIGADDIFVFVDTWNSAPSYDVFHRKVPNSLRLSWAYKKAGSAMLSTSLTTSLAFFGSIVSDIPPIRQFGFFMGFLVAMNYLMIMTWFPAVLMFQQVSRQCLGQRCAVGPCKRRFEKTQEEEKEEDKCERSLYIKALWQRAIREAIGQARGIKWHVVRPITLSETLVVPKKTAKTKCMETYHLYLHKARWVVVGISAIFVTIFFWQAAMISTPTEMPMIFPKDHNVEQWKVAEEHISTAGSSRASNWDGAGVSTCPDTGCSSSSTAVTNGGTIPTGLGGGIYTGGGTSPIDNSQVGVTVDGAPFPIPLTDPSDSAAMLLVPQSPFFVAMQLNGPEALQLRITWQSPYHTGATPIDHYAVALSDDNGTSWLPGFAMTENPLDLEWLQWVTKPDTLYTVRMAAHNSAGYGQVSGPVSVTTRSTSPSAPLSPVLGALGTDGTVALSWSVPDWLGQGVSGQSLLIYSIWINDPSSATNSLQLDDEEMIVQSTGDNALSGVGVACANTDRIFCIRAHSTVSSSLSKCSEKFLVQFPAGPPSAPIVTIDSFTSATANVTLTPAPCDGGSAFTTYTLYPAPSLPPTTTSDSTFFFFGLSELTTYDLGVTASNADHGEGPPTVASLTTTAAAPGPVTAIAVASVDDSRLDVSWTLPAYEGEGGLQSIEIRYRRQLDSPNGAYTTVNLAHDAVSTQLTGLVAETVYEVLVDTTSTLATNTAALITGSTLELILYPEITLAPPAVVLSASVGESTKGDMVSLDNTGQGDFAVTGATYSESWLSLSPAAFTQQPSDPTRSLNVVADVSALSRGTYSGVITLQHNDLALGSSQAINITVDLEMLAVAITAPTATVKLNTPHPGTNVNSLFQVANSGDGTLTLSGLSATGALSARVTTGLVFNIALLETETQDIDFDFDVSGLAAGVYTGNLVLQHDAPLPSSTTLIPYEVIVVAADASLSTLTIASEVDKAATATTTEVVVVTNTGTPLSTLSGIITGAPAWIINIDPSTLSVSGGASQSVTLTIDPTLAGDSETTNLLFDFDAPVADISLTVDFAKLAADILVTTTVARGVPLTLDGVTAPSTYPPLAVTDISVNNTGSLALQISDVSSPAYALTSFTGGATSVSIAAGATKTLTVVWSSVGLGVGVFSASDISLTHNALAGGQTQTAIQASLTVTDAAILQVAEPPSTLSGIIEIGTSTVAMDFTLSNPGTSALTLTAPVSSDTGMSITDVTPNTVGVGAVDTVVTVTVSTDHLVPGTQTGTITWDHNAAPLSVGGDKLVVDYSVDVLAGAFAISKQSSLHLSTLYGATFQDTLLAVNAGNAAVDWYVNAGGPAWISHDAPLIGAPETLAPGQTRTVTVSFDMGVNEGLAMYNGTLQFMNDAGPQMDLEIAVEVLSSPLRTASLDLGVVLLAASVDVTTSLSGIGGNLQITGLEVDFNSVSNSVARSDLIPASATPLSHTLALADTLAEGDYSGSLTWTHDYGPATDAIMPFTLTLIKPMIALVTPSLDVSCKIGLTTTEQIIIRNDGTAPLSVTVSVTGSAWLTGATAFVVASGATKAHTMNFDASGLAKGLYSGQIDLAHDSPVAGRSSNIPFTFTVQAPRIVLDTAGVDKTVTTADANFGHVVTVTNTGDWPLTLGALSVQAGNTWLSAQLASTTVPAGLSVDLTLTYTVPGAAATLGPADVSLIHDGDTASPSTFSVSMTVTDVSEATITNSAIAWASTPGKALHKRTISIGSTGSTALIVSSVVVDNGSGALTSTFKFQDGTSNFPTIAAGSSDALTIEWDVTSTTTGSYPGSITIGHNAPDSPTVIAFTGSISEPVISVDNSAISSPNLQDGSTTPYVTSRQITNTGTGDLTVSLSTIGSVAWVDFDQTQLTVAGTPQNVQVRLIPTGLPTGIYEDTMQITHDGGAGGVIDIALTMTIVGGLLIVDTTGFVDTTQRYEGTGSAQLAQVPLSNTGQFAVTIANVVATTTPVEDAWLSVVSTFPITIPPGGNSQLSISRDVSGISLDAQATISAQLSFDVDSPVQGGSSVFVLSIVVDPVTPCPVGDPVATECSGHPCDLSGQCSCPADTAGLACNDCPRSGGVVCMGLGTCVDSSGKAACVGCDPASVGPACEVCPQVTGGICSGVGECKWDETSSSPVCECGKGYAGVDCEITCDCNGRGGCDASGECDCDTGFLGSKCELACPGVPETGFACNNNGTCGLDATHYNTTECSCTNALVAGSYCHLECPGLVESIQGGLRVCSNHGVCNKDARCSCAEGWLGQTCNETIAEDALSLLPAASVSLEVQFFFGISSVDKSHIKVGDITSKPIAIFDTSFDASDPVVQVFLVNMCDELWNSTLRIRNEYSTCPMREFRDWVVALPDPYNTFPVRKDYFMTFWLNWLATVSDIPGGSFGVDDEGTRVTFIQLKLRTYVKRNQAGSLLQPAYDEWQLYADAQNAKSPSGAGTMIHYSDQYPRMVVEVAFIWGTAAAMTTSLVTAFTAIIVFTGNLLLAVIATGIMTCTIGCILGFFVLQGWAIGAIEAISLSIVVGLSVDYSLHLGHSYIHQLSTDRVDRVKGALSDIGPSILASSITTFLSMLVLFFCVVQIFVIIGSIIAFTIFLSIIFSLGTFCAILLICGPNGTACNLTKLCICFANRHEQQQKKLTTIRTTHGVSNVGRSMLSVGLSKQLGKQLTKQFSAIHLGEDKESLSESSRGESEVVVVEGEGGQVESQHEDAQREGQEGEVELNVLFDGDKEMSAHDTDDDMDML